MGKYNCEICGKEFTQKSHYNQHNKRKTPCVSESRLQELINIAVDKKIESLIKEGKIEGKLNSIVSNISQNKKMILVKETDKDVHIPKPILKWVGGKTQILDKLITEFPVNMNNYHEIFIGGGSVLLALLSYIKEGVITVEGDIYAYDLNEPLIFVYKNIQSNYNKLYDKIQELKEVFDSCDGDEINRKPKTIEEAKTSKESYYYWIRTQYNKLKNKTSIKGSAMFIFLNKTCFRGLFREGPNGFNVPYGHYKNPGIIDLDHLEEIHDLIKDVKFKCCDFTTSLNEIEEDDFVYLDPPYAPETKTSFVKYTEKAFDIENHKELFELCNILTENKKNILLSNADVSLVRDSFPEEQYTINTLLCKRAINSKKPQSKTMEVLIKNY